MVRWPIIENVSEAARIAVPGEDVSLAELQLAARNHGMPLEALRYDVTPAGLHYLLVHYDIPMIDPASWRLRVTGQVDRELTLDLAALRALPRRTIRGDHRMRRKRPSPADPRPVSQPWLNEAVGTAEWTGTPLAAVLAEAGTLPGAVDVGFTGADHGIERGVEQDYARGLDAGRRTGRRGAAGRRDERRPTAAAARRAAAAGRPRVVRHGARQMAADRSRCWTDRSTGSRTRPPTG